MLGLVQVDPAAQHGQVADQGRLGRPGGILASDRRDALRSGGLLLFSHPDAVRFRPLACLRTACVTIAWTVAYQASRGNQSTTAAKRMGYMFGSAAAPPRLATPASVTTLGFGRLVGCRLSPFVFLCSDDARCVAAEERTGVSDGIDPTGRHLCELRILIALSARSCPPLVPLHRCVVPACTAELSRPASSPDWPDSRAVAGGWRKMPNGKQIASADTFRTEVGRRRRRLDRRIGRRRNQHRQRPRHWSFRHNRQRHQPCSADAHTGCFRPKTANCLFSIRGRQVARRCFVNSR